MLAGALVAALVLAALFLWPGWIGSTGSTDSQQSGDSAPTTAVSAPLASPTDTDHDDAVELTDATRAQLDTELDGSSAQLAGAVVIDPNTGDLLYERAPGQLLIPASNQKILTELAVFHFLDPEQRLATTVVQGGSEDTVVLVGGGDTLLSPGDGDPDAVEGRAGIADLARQTAESMDLAPVPEQLTLEVDGSLFSGSGLNPGWAPADIARGEVGPVSPMAFDSHRVVNAENTAGGGYEVNASVTVAEVFASALSRELTQKSGQPVTVSVGAMVDTPADPLKAADVQSGVTELARVESATVQEQSAVMMKNSDNRLAETLCRVAAVSGGHSGDPDGARTAMQQALQDALGYNPVERHGVVLSDCAGLSAGNRVTPEVLGEVLTVGAQEPEGPYGSMLETFPTSGRDGTLADRFQAPGAAEGQDHIRAKTGTLNGVTVLSGDVNTDSGEHLIAVVMLNETADQQVARDSADRFFTALAQA